MSAISRNIIANALGGCWIVCLTLIVIPIQVRILGVEAFGILGLLTILQTVFALLDLGMNATLTQFAATDAAPGRPATRQLASAAVAVYLGPAVAAGLTLISLADWLSINWLQVSTYHAETIASAIKLIAIAVVLRCPGLIFSALIAGLNRLDVINALKSATQSIRLLGGLLILAVWRELLPLLCWEVAVAAIESITFFAACRRLLPGLMPLPHYRSGVMHGKWHYALGMNAVSLIAVLLTQTDKFSISKMMPLEFLGYYQIAYGATAWISLVQGGFNSAVLPSLAADFANGRNVQLRARNAKITQLTVYAVTLPTAAIVFFSTEILELWVGRNAAGAAAAVASLLSAGFLLNAAVSNCLTLAVASGNAAIPLRVNLIGLAIYLPALVILMKSGGITGAAIAWVILNTYYLLVLVPMVQQRLLKQGFIDWMRENFLPFVALAVAFFGCARAAIYLVPDCPIPMLWGLIIAAALGYAASGYWLLARDLREQIAASVYSALYPARRG